MKKTKLTTAGFFLAAVLLGCLGTIPLQAEEKAAPNKKIKVFILSGQSGMAGFGDSTKLSDAMRKGNDRILMFEGGKWQPLRPFNVYPDSLMKQFGLTEYSFGPEIAFAYAKWDAQEAIPNSKMVFLRDVEKHVDGTHAKSAGIMEHGRIFAEGCLEVLK